MGVLNATPDSFSDGGRYLDEHSARARVDELLAHGADIIDIGGESTRPGSAPVPAHEQIRRTLPAIDYAVARNAVVSIDTTSPQVAQTAIDHGASIVNDVSCLRDGPELARVAARAGASLVIMHAREPMSSMPGFSICPDDAYGDVVADVAREWLAAARVALEVGMPRDDLFLDPGLGFNKNARHSNELVARLDELVALGFGVVVGPSRKSFLAAEIKTDPSRRLGGTIAACLACAAHGASVLRVHDVIDVRQALSVARATGMLPARPTFPEVAHVV